MVFLAENGLYPERLEYFKSRVVELEALRESMFADYLRSFDILDKITAQPPEPLPRWFRWMSLDDYIDPRRTLRHYDYPRT